MKGPLRVPSEERLRDANMMHFMILDNFRRGKQFLSYEDLH